MVYFYNQRHYMLKIIFKKRSYFANLEKKHSARKTVKCLKVNDWVIILKEECKLYKSIYQKEYNCKPDINFFNVTSNTLKEEEKLIMSCEGWLTECFKALKEIKNDKNPGSDWITVEF